jgi:hypothetical protein
MCRIALLARSVDRAAATIEPATLVWKRSLAELFRDQGSRSKVDGHQSLRSVVFSRESIGNLPISWWGNGADSRHVCHARSYLFVLLSFVSTTQLGKNHQPLLLPGTFHATG